MMDYRTVTYPVRKFEPKADNHPTIGQPCPACDQPFKSGEYTTLLMLGPGDDSEARERARAGRPYTAVAMEVHWACVTGEEE